MSPTPLPREPDAIDDTAAAVLQQRARQLARRDATNESADAQERLELLEFCLGGERFAVETRHVSEVFPLRHLTPLPGTPDFVLGVVNVRGRVAAVLSVKRFLALPERGLADLHRVVLIGDGEAGLLADLSVRVFRIDRRDVLPRLPGSAPHVVGLLPDGVVVLDAARILADPRWQVDDLGNESP